MSNLPQCPKCKNEDKVEPIASVVAYTFSETPLPNSEGITWAGKTYYVKPRLPTVTARKKNSFLNLQSEVRTNILIPLIEIKSLPKVTSPGKTFRVLDVYLLRGMYMFWILFGLFIGRVGAKKNIISLPLLGSIIIILSIVCLIFINAIIKAARLMNLKEQAEYNHKLRNISQAEEKWKQLFYCYRDKGVFLANGKFVLIEEMDKFLFSEQDASI